MEASKMALLVFLLVLSFRRAHPSETVATPMSPVETPENNPTSDQNETLPASTTPTDDPGPACLIDTLIGLIAVASAGGLILCLLISTLVLACQVYRLQRRVRAPRPSRSNVDLVSGTGFWGTDCRAVGGVAEPSETSVLLQEVTDDGKMVEKEDVKPENKSENKEDDGDAREATKQVDRGDGETAIPMQCSSSRDSCLEVPDNLEDMPLVV